MNEKVSQAVRYLGQLTDSKLPKLLMLTHAMGGGVDRHLAELSVVLQGRAHVLLLSPESAGPGLRLQLPAVEQCGAGLELAFDWPEQADLLWCCLAQVGITQIHVHHVLNWPADFWPVFLARELPFDLTLHDHCIFSTVVREQAASADMQQWLVRVQRCFARETRVQAECLQELARRAPRVIVPSQVLRERVQQFFPEIADQRLLFCPHPEAELQGIYPEPWLRPLKEGQPLRVLCLGMLSAEKGAQVLGRVAREAEKQNVPLEFHLLGSCHVHLPSCIQRHGSYDDHQLQELLKQIDPHVLWLPAQSPETWSYTLSAGLHAGLPVVATGIGAFPERLQRRPLSWICGIQFSTSQWLGAFVAVRDKHTAKDELVQTWRPASAHAFYTAEEGGYVLTQARCLLEGGEPLDEWQLESILWQGKPVSGGWRSHWLRALWYCKTSPVLSPLIRLIPYGWQRRVKRLISRAPLHEPPR